VSALSSLDDLAAKQQSNSDSDTVAATNGFTCILNKTLKSSILSWTSDECFAGSFFSVDEMSGTGRNFILSTTWHMLQDSTVYQTIFVKS